MEVENQQQYEEGEENQKQLDTSEETEDGLMEQRGDDALEHQDDGVVDTEDKEIVGATVSLQEPGDMTEQEDMKQNASKDSDLEEEDMGVEPADLEVKVHVPKEEGCSEKDAEQTSDPEQEDSGVENEDTAGDRKPADLELVVHVSKEDGADEKEKDEPQGEADDDKVTDLDEDAENTGRVAADLELLVQDPNNDAEKISETKEPVGRVVADLELMVQNPDNEAERISEIPKEPEIQKVPADLEVRVHNTDTDRDIPKSGKEPAELELLVQKDENDNDNEPTEIHRNGDVKAQEKPEMKAKPKAGSVKNSIAKFNNTETKKVFLQILLSILKLPFFIDIFLVHH